MATIAEMAQQFVAPAIETQLSQMYDVTKNLTATTLKKLHQERIHALEATFEATLANLKLLNEALANLHRIQGSRPR